MSARPRTALSAVSACIAGMLILVGCGSDAATVSQSQVEAKLKKDSQVKSLLDQLPSAAKSKSDVIISCIAKALKKDASGGTLDDYVNGDGSLDDIRGKDSDSKDKATADVKSCVTTALGG